MLPQQSKRLAHNPKPSSDTAARTLGWLPVPRIRSSLRATLVLAADSGVGAPRNTPVLLRHPALLSNHNDTAKPRNELTAQGTSSCSALIRFTRSGSEDRIVRSESANCPVVAALVEKIATGE